MRITFRIAARFISFNYIYSGGFSHFKYGGHANVVLTHAHTVQKIQKDTCSLFRKSGFVLPHMSKIAAAGCELVLVHAAGAEISARLQSACLSGGIESARNRVFRADHAVRKVFKRIEAFADFGNVNAIERLSAIITELYQYKIPAGSAKTTFNVGTISGGTTVNSIAAQAEMLYEMRSDDYACLMDAKAYFEKILEEFKAEGVDVTAELLGERPCGNKENHDPRQTALLTQCADAVENHFGTRPGVYAGSTDCNIPLANGVPAAAIGLCVGAGEHTRGEWIETESLKAGFKVAAELISARFLPEEKGE